MDLEEETIRKVINESENIVSLYDNLSYSICKNKDASFFVDKTPWPPRFYRLWYTTLKFKKSKWIHIVRDGRDCYCSARHHPHVPHSEDIASFAKYWRTRVKNQESTIPDAQRYTMRYEDLTRSPSDTIKAVMKFIGLPYEPKQIEESTRQDYDLGPEGAHSRLRKPISDSNVGRWKEELDFEEAVAFERHAGHCLRKFGYSEAAR